MQLFDMHCHSLNSHDGKSTVNKLCQSAIRASLSGIAITDHCEFGEYLLPDWKERYEKSISDAIECKEIFDGRLKVLTGTEMAQIYLDFEKANKIYNDSRLDFALSSIHSLEGKEDFCVWNWDGVDVNAVYEEYLTQVYTTSCFDVYDSLAHITYPLRYMRRSGLAVPTGSVYEDLYLEIFKEVASKDKAIELNVSELLRGGITLPEIRELKMFKSVGGKYVTIGSDCHDAKNLGLQMDKAVSILRMSGFEYQTIFIGHKPRLIELH